jgi:hypothetical protein
VEADALVDQILELAGDRYVLIGGQALAFWATYFEVPLPTALASGVTRDIDFLTDRPRAIALLDELKARFGTQVRTHVATMDDITVNLAKAVIGADEMEIDLVSAVHGEPRHGEVQSQAQTWLRADGRALLLLHPIDCLRTRVWNLSLPSKNEQSRLPKSLGQVELAIGVVRAYLPQVENPRKQLDHVERIIKLANSRQGRQAWKDFQVDPLRAIPVEAIRSERFRAERWPRVQEHFAEQRAGSPSMSHANAGAGPATRRRPR